MHEPALAMQRAKRVRCAFCPVLYQFCRATHGKEYHQELGNETQH
jgi:hypothetical protein